MSPFHSMTHVTIYIVITAFLLLLFALRANPFSAAGSFVHEVLTSKKYVIHFAAMVAILFFNKIELWVEKRMTHRTDFTPTIFKLEGNFVAAIQHLFHNDALTFAAGYFYVVVFPALTIASIGIYTYRKQYKLFYAVCYALIINYMVAIPFYLFFPVNEVWSFHPDVKFLLKDVFPTFETDYRPLSGLDNCFPSLHTSISVSMAVIAMKSGNTFWRWFTALSAAFIIFSIFYLGIHWLVDMSGGFALGMFAAKMALRVGESRLPVAGYPLQRWKERNFVE
jgi:membrane-associated phospholipid phosphatase